MTMKTERESGLTKRIVVKATYDGDATKKEKCILWDNNPVGLGLRTYPSGGKKWVLQYRNAEGKQRLMTLAAFGVYTLDEARTQAKNKLRNLASDGVDPLREKKQLRIEAKTDNVQAVIEGWVAAVTPKTAKDILRRAEMYTYPAFRKRSWRAIARSEVREWLAKLGNTASRAVANAAFSDLRAAIYWRIWMEDDATGVAVERRDYQRDARNPCAGVKQFQKVVREVRIDPEDWTKFAAAIEAETSPERHKNVVAGQGARFKSNHAKTDPYMHAIFHFLIAEGCRKSEARKLKWTEVNFNARTVTFRGTKARNGEIRERTVPLSPYALEILKGLEPVKGNPFVFVGFVKNQPLSNINDAWDRIRKRAGFPHVTIHDLRRSFGSWLGDVGFSDKQVGAVLGHKSIVTSRVYMQLSQAPKQRAVDAVGALIDLARRKRTRKGKAPTVNFDAHGNVLQSSPQLVKPRAA